MSDPTSLPPASPGAYLRLRREAKNLSLDDLALMTETNPAVSARSRAEWLATIEDDIAPITIRAALRLHELLEFDWNVLIGLCAVAEGVSADVADICRVCGCSEFDPCEEEHGGTCAWAAPTLCTRCAASSSALAAAA